MVQYIYKLDQSNVTSKLEQTIRQGITEVYKAVQRYTEQ